MLLYKNSQTDISSTTSVPYLHSAHKQWRSTDNPGSGGTVFVWHQRLLPEPLIMIIQTTVRHKETISSILTRTTLLTTVYRFNYYTIQYIRVKANRRGPGRRGVCPKKQVLHLLHHGIRLQSIRGVTLVSKVWGTILSFLYPLSSPPYFLHLRPPRGTLRTPRILRLCNHFKFLSKYK